MPDAPSPQNQKEPRPWMWRAGLAAVVLAVLAGVYLLRPRGAPSPKAPGEPAVSGRPDGSFIQGNPRLGGASRASGVSAARSGEGGGISSDVLDEMHRCFRAPELAAQGLEDESDSPNAPPEAVRILGTEEALAEIEKEWGPAMMQGDLWTDWIVRLPDGLDRRVHLENIEEGGGRIRRNLSLFQIDQSGKAKRVPLTEAEERNPGMAMISNLLNEGEILRKETSRYYQFAGGERLEIIELDGRPIELEIVHGEIFFRCDKMEGSDSCACIR